MGPRGDDEPGNAGSLDNGQDGDSFEFYWSAISDYFFGPPPQPARYIQLSGYILAEFRNFPTFASTIPEQGYWLTRPASARLCPEAGYGCGHWISLGDTRTYALFSVRGLREHSERYQRRETRMPPEPEWALSFGTSHHSVHLPALRSFREEQCTIAYMRTPPHRCFLRSCETDGGDAQGLADFVKRATESWPVDFQRAAAQNPDPLNRDLLQLPAP